MLQSVFSGLSHSTTIRRWAEQSDMGRHLASRFVAGRTIEEAIAACRRINAEKITVSLDSLGESVTSEAEARTAANVYYGLLDAIHRDGLNATVSLKLTQMGIDIRQELAEELVSRIVQRATEASTFVRIDMESSQYTESTIQAVERLHVRFPGAIGAVLQACLYRTGRDVERLLGQGIGIRLCKGAYSESPNVAFPQKPDVDANFAKLMKRMVSSGVFCGIATHDEQLIRELRRFTKQNGIAAADFEFQMLYGVRRNLQRRLARMGYRVRVYIPFGTAWYPYLMRRLAERPANVMFLAKNLVRR